MKKFLKYRRRLIKWSHFRFNNYFRMNVREGYKWCEKRWALIGGDPICYSFYGRKIYEKYCKKYGPVPLYFDEEK